MMASAATTNNPNALNAGKADFADTEAAALLAGRLEELSAPGANGWTMVKHNSSRTVYRARIDEKDLFLKHYHSRSRVHRIGRRLGFSDAKCEMHFASYLASRGVPTPRPLAALCCDGVEWLVTEAIGPAAQRLLTEHDLYIFHHPFFSF